MKIRFFLDTNITHKDGSHPLRIYIYFSAKDRKSPFTNYASQEKDWNFKTQEPKKTHPQFFAILDFLLEYRRKINLIENSRDFSSSNQVESFLFSKSSNLYSFWESRIEELKSIKKTGNAQFYTDYLNAWKSYKQNIEFDEIDYNFLTKFKIYKLKTITPGGVNVYIKAIRAIYNEAVKRGIYRPKTHISPFTEIMEKTPPTKDKHLTLEEFKKVYKINSQHRFYLYFMLQFYLGGLDFIDIASIKKSHIKKNRIKFERFKGGTSEIIDNFICPEAQEILDFFNDPESEFLLPIHKFSYKPYRDKYVREIRKIFNYAKITSYTDSKTPRYSFIHIGSKELQLNREVIKELVGHAKNDTTSIYEGKYSNEIKYEIHQKIINAIKLK